MSARTDPIQKRVTEDLALLKRPASAQELASRLGLTRPEVNRALYSGLGVRYLKTDEARPRWSLLSEEIVTKRTPAPLKFPSVRPREFRIDQQGGDWTVTLLVAARSRNDPPFQTEMIGVRNIRVLLNSSVLGGDLDQPSVGSAAVLLAAVALTLQIMRSRNATLEDFDFELVMRDALLAFSASS